MTSPIVQGRCPACGTTSLLVGDGGHVTCSLDVCPNPSAVDELLHGDIATRSTNTLLDRRMVASAALYNSTLVRALNAEGAVDSVREYAATSDDDGRRTREAILRIVGNWPGPGTSPARVPATQATEADDLIRERCPHCPETLPRNRVDDHVTTAHADLSPCTASIHVRTNDTTYRCAFRVGHNGEYGALHASAYAKRGGRYVWDDEHDGAIPHRDAGPAAPGWSRKADGTWTLLVDGGTVTVPAHFTPLDSDRADTGWKQNSQPAPCADCIAGAHDPNYHRRRRGLPPPPPSTEEQIVGALHELASSVRDLVSALRLETADRSNCATAHDIKGD
ncbi:hypothetical protein ACFC8N_42810 [Streptomyces sp. NPDC055966]|uniref:hypothetical protein n=1 Tax=Streptomyces sp. NPDC055966 TaxID=3345669 RepID=UPI0035E229CC